nr:hypothetical protein [Pedobacter sp. ASV2]
MKKITLLLTCCLFGACMAQNKMYKRLPIGTMEKFDIEIFNKQKDKFSQFLETKNHITISKGWNNTNYGEFITEENNPSSYYKTLSKVFYADGIIKERGYDYSLNKSYFQIGIWEYFDKNGKLIRTEDFDKQYKIGYRKALDILAKKYGYHQNNLFIDVNGDNWYIENIKGSKKGRMALVNQNIGKVEEGTVRHNY